MTLKRVTCTLNTLRCIAQGESGGSEPYLWVTYFAVGAQKLPFQPGNVGVNTPSYNGFRAEIPNNVKAGQVIPIPIFISRASFEIEFDNALPKMIGCIGVLMEEDETSEDDIARGHIAYSKEMDAQLNALVDKRIAALDFSPVTDEETNSIKSAVKSKVEDGVAQHQSLWSLLFTNQDDNIGFCYKTFVHSGNTMEIVPGDFDFPEMTDGGSNRFVLSGSLSVETIHQPHPQEGTGSTNHGGVLIG